MENITINNFWKIKDEWSLDLAPVTFFVGPNNSGKSSVLKAFLLLEDYIKSDNHFELNFDGDNALRHKINSYSNAINWLNNQGLNEDRKLDLCINYENELYEINLKFTPLEINKKSEKFEKGKLKELIVINSRNQGKIHLQNEGNDHYQLTIDSTFFNTYSKEKSNSSLKNLQQRLARIYRTLAVIQKKKEELKPTDKAYIELNTEESTLRTRIYRLNSAIAELEGEIESADYTLSPAFKLRSLYDDNLTFSSVLKDISMKIILVFNISIL